MIDGLICAKELLQKEKDFLKSQLENNVSYDSNYLQGVIRGIELCKAIINNKISWTHRNLPGIEDEDNDEGEDVILFERDQEGKVVIYPEASQEIKGDKQ